MTVVEGKMVTIIQTKNLRKEMVTKSPAQQSRTISLKLKESLLKNMAKAERSQKKSMRIGKVYQKSKRNHLLIPPFTITITRILGCTSSLARVQLKTRLEESSSITITRVSTPPPKWSLYHSISKSSRRKRPRSLSTIHIS